MDQQDLDEAFQFVLSSIKIACKGKDTPIVSFKQSEGFMNVFGVHGDFQVSFKILNDEKSWKQAISIDGNLLYKVFKDKKEVSLIPSDNYSTLSIVKKGFKGTYNSISYETLLSSYEQDYKKISFVKPIISTSIKAMENLKTLVDYSRYIRVISNGSIISCGTGDNFHVLFVKEDKKEANVDFCIPVELAKLIAAKHVDTIYLSENRLKAKGERIDIETALVPPNKVLHTSRIPDMIKQQKEASFTIKVSELSSGISTINAKDSTTISIAFSDKMPVISVKASSFEAKKKLEAHSLTCVNIKTVDLNMKNFVESLSAFDKKEEITISLLQNSICISSLGEKMIGLIVANRIE